MDIEKEIDNIVTKVTLNDIRKHKEGLVLRGLLESLMNSVRKECEEEARKKGILEGILKSERILSMTGKSVSSYETYEAIGRAQQEIASLKFDLKPSND